jgi:hypothetical protein
MVIDPAKNGVIPSIPPHLHDEIFMTHIEMNSGSNAT